MKKDERQDEEKAGKPMDPEKLIRLIMGNEGDEVALQNICEAQGEDIDTLTDDEKKFFYHTNSFYYNAEEYIELHESDEEEFQMMLDSGVIVKTKDGYVFLNCV